MEKLNHLIKQAEAALEPGPEKHLGNEKLEELAHELIQRRLNKLGLNNVYPKAALVYSGHKEKNTLGTFNVQTGDIKVAVESEADLSVVIHELLHAYSSDLGRFNVQEIDVKVPPTRLVARGGFSTLWQTIEGEKYFLFKVIDEAVTESIALELAQEAGNEYKSLAPYFNESKTAKRTEIDNDYLHRKIPESEKTKKMLLAQREKAVDFLERLDQMLKSAIMQQQLEAIDELNDIKAKFTQELDIIDDLLLKQLEESTRDESEYRKILREIEIRYFFDVSTSPSSYVNEREILKIFLLHYSLAIMEDNPDIDALSAYQKAWQEMQIAYFTGNVFFLRKFNKYLDTEILTKLENFYDLDDTGRHELVTELRIKLYSG